MIKEARIAVLLGSAKEAEKEAEKAKDDETKVQWLRIAEGYRVLAKLAHSDPGLSA